MIWNEIQVLFTDYLESGYRKTVGSLWILENSKPKVYTIRQATELENMVPKQKVGMISMVYLQTKASRKVWFCVLLYII